MITKALVMLLDMFQGCEVVVNSAKSSQDVVEVLPCPRRSPC